MRFILRLDDSGVVKEARADSEAALANCMEKGWLGVQYSVPPVAPFYNMVTLEARSRGGV